MIKQIKCKLCQGDHHSRFCEAFHRLIFAGDRKWNDRALIRQVMTYLQDNLGKFVVIEGEAAGADSISRSLAELEFNIPVDAVPAEWTTFGKAAGPIRNAKMLREHRASGLVAFHNELGNSKGTANMVHITLKAGKPVWTSSLGLDKLPEFIAKLKGEKH